ncbi:MAG: metallo-mystery pair system four-Cys motif protein [Acidobacteria bacterium]|nr:metallo-mystery pair system four-Cys motif protein [Acidobacteriota bacterium]
MKKNCLLLIFAGAVFAAEPVPVSIRFAARVNGAPFACGQKFEGVGTTASTLSPRDFRFYVHNVRLVDSAGQETPVEVRQDGKWQLDGVALLDFENATGGCTNGTPDLNDVITGTVPAGKQWRGVRFTLGVPFEKNHTDLTTMPSPLNLTALSWVWNAGRKFARLDFASTGLPRGVAIHLGSTGCTPNTTKTTVPTQCSEPNRAEVTLAGFDPVQDVVVADLGRLLKDSNVDVNQEKTPSGCMSGLGDSDCAPIFANFGLPFNGQSGKQTFFAADRPAKAPGTSTRTER